LKKKNHGKLVSALVFVSISVLVAENRVTADTATRQIMHGVFDAIAYLLPLSVRNPETSSEWDRELINSKLTLLQDSSRALAAHTAGQSPEFRFLARSFDETVREIDTSFKAEWPSYAFFPLMELTQHCVACHSQQPADSQPAFSQRLLARVNTELFDPTELAQLYVATRQFDAALSALERKLLAPTEDAIDLDFEGTLLEYLSLALGVADAPARADKLLHQFEQRVDAPYYLKQRIVHWRERLSVLKPELSAPPSLDKARGLFAAATTEFRGERDRTAAIDDLVVTSILRRYLAAQTEKAGAAVAEAYYMLGVISLRTMEPKFSVPQLEVLLASTIKADPHGAFAKRAYLLLEEFGYVRDVHLARAEKTNTLIDMGQLRGMIEPRTTAQPTK
jgi:hypothetical protein